MTDDETVVMKGAGSGMGRGLARANSELEQYPMATAGGD